MGWERTVEQQVGLERIAHGMHKHEVKAITRYKQLTSRSYLIAAARFRSPETMLTTWYDRPICPTKFGPQS